MFLVPITLEAEKVTKSDIIRKGLAAYPDLGPTALAAKLQAENRGLKFLSNEISNLKTKQKAGNGKPAMPSAATQTAVTPAATVSVSSSNGHTDSATLADNVAKLIEASQALGKEKAMKLLEIL